MRKLSWIVTLPIAAVVIAFAVANQTPTRFDLWPFALSYELPLFLVVFGFFVIGFILGGIVLWISSGHQRAEARRARYRANDLERDVATLKRKLKQETEARQRAEAANAAGSPRGELPAPYASNALATRSGSQPAASQRS